MRPRTEKSACISSKLASGKKEETDGGMENTDEHKDGWTEGKGAKDSGLQMGDRARKGMHTIQRQVGKKKESMEGAMKTQRLSPDYSHPCRCVQLPPLPGVTHTLISPAPTSS